HAPDELYSLADLAATGSATAPPNVIVFGQYFGSEAELRKLVQPLANTGTPTNVSFASSWYIDSVVRYCGQPTLAKCIAQGQNPTRATFAAKSDYVNKP